MVFLLLGNILPRPEETVTYLALCAIWLETLHVTVSRLYKDGDDWKDSTSFGRDDLPLVAKVADQAHSYIFGCNQS